MMPTEKTARLAAIVESFLNDCFRFFALMTVNFAVERQRWTAAPPQSAYLQVYGAAILTARN